jgi:hypothetical protein
MKPVRLYRYLLCVLAISLVFPGVSAQAEARSQ